MATVYFDTPGDFDWTVPDGVTQITVLTQQAGFSGGNGEDQDGIEHGGKGGDGGDLSNDLYDVTPGSIVNVHVPDSDDNTGGVSGVDVFFNSNISDTPGVVGSDGEVLPDAASGGDGGASGGGASGGAGGGPGSNGTDGSVAGGGGGGGGSTGGANPPVQGIGGVGAHGFVHITYDDGGGGGAASALLLCSSTLTASAFSCDIVAALLACSSTLTASAFSVSFAAANLSCVSTLTASAFSGGIPTASLTCSSTLTASAFSGGIATAHLGCVSTLIAVSPFSPHAIMHCHSMISAQPTIFGQFHKQAMLSCSASMDALAADALFAEAELQCVATMSPTAVVMFIHAQASMMAVSSFVIGPNAFPSKSAAAVLVASNTLVASVFLVHYPKADLLCQASMEGTIETFVDPTVLPPMDLIAQSSRQVKLPAASSAVTELPASSR